MKHTIKNTIKQTDYLIIGQGLAGTFFAHELDKNGHQFMMIDPDVHNASKTAAGMYNPVVLKRFSAVWQGQQQIATAKQTVTEIEQILAAKLAAKTEKSAANLDYPMDIFRIFHDEAEKVTWTKKAANCELKGLLDTQFYPSFPSIIAPLGLGRIISGGKIDVKSLLANYRTYLVNNRQILTEHLDYQRLSYQNGQWIYQGKTITVAANKVVCCEGYGIKENPYFNGLPLKGNKGEVLIVKAPQLNLSAAIKSKVFIMPMTELGEAVYFVGATYNWTDKDTVPTVAAKQDLLVKLSQFVSGDIQVLSHQAGIRPTVTDRRPLLGQHAEQPQLYILNGLGTRGVMLGASMAKHLYQLTECQVSLPLAIDIRRFSTV